MDNLPDIFNTPLVPEEINKFWEDAASVAGDMAPKDILVISCPLGNEGRDKAQLLKMLQACKLEDYQYNLIELPADTLIAWYRLREQLKPRYILLVGIEPQQLGMSVIFMPHQVSRFDEAVWVFTWSVPQLEQYPDAKKHLWGYGLKPVFIDRSFG